MASHRLDRDLELAEDVSAADGVDGRVGARGDDDLVLAVGATTISATPGRRAGATSVSTSGAAQAGKRLVGERVLADGAENDARRRRGAAATAWFALSAGRARNVASVSVSPGRGSRSTLYDEIEVRRPDDR